MGTQSLKFKEQKLKLKITLRAVGFKSLKFGEPKVEIENYFKSCGIDPATHLHFTVDVVKAVLRITENTTIVIVIIIIIIIIIIIPPSPLSCVEPCRFSLMGPSTACDYSGTLVVLTLCVCEPLRTIGL